MSDQTYFPITLIAHVNNDDLDDPTVDLIATCGREQQIIATAHMTGHKASQDLRAVARAWLESYLKESEAEAFREGIRTGHYHVTRGKWGLLSETELDEIMQENYYT